MELRLMFHLRLILIALFCLLGVETTSAGSLVGWADADRACADGWADGWNERRAMRRLFPGRMQLTLGEAHRRHWRERCPHERRWRDRAVPFWSRWHDPHGRFAGEFYGFNDVYGPGRPILRPRHGARSFHWRYEGRPKQRRTARRAYPGHDARATHLAWCHDRYRSYRAHDNTFQPYKGARRACVSPYGR